MFANIENKLIDMGSTKLQQRIFTLMMCIGMVLGMTAYNIILQIGFSSDLFNLLFKEIWVVFIIALILDLFIVGPLVKKQVFSILKRDTKKIIIILSISLGMVTSMVLLMSIFGSIFMKGFTLDAILNIIVVAPIARFLFVKFFPSTVTN